jgi:ATP synthase protein I
MVRPPSGCGEGVILHEAKGGREAMSDNAPEPDDLRSLGERLDELKRQNRPPKQAVAPTSGEVAIRFATELLSAVVVGAAIGWGLDWLLGTRPILTVVLFLLGAGAGIRNVVRASKEITERTSAAAQAAEEEKER